MRITVRSASRLENDNFQLLINHLLFLGRNLTVEQRDQLWIYHCILICVLRAMLLKKDFDSFDEMIRALTAQHFIQGGRAPMIRTDILRKHNLDIPGTFEELYTVLKKLKEAYSDAYRGQQGASGRLQVELIYRDALAIHCEPATYDTTRSRLA